MSVRWLRPPAVEKSIFALLTVGLVGYWVFRSGTREPAYTKHHWVPKGNALGRLQSKSAGVVQPFLEPLNPAGRQWDVLNCRRCSIVGNTGLLLHSSMGSRIDATNCVFRFGFAPTDKSYSRDVGERTTLRLVDTTSLKEADFDELQTLNDAHHVVIFDTERSSLASTKADAESLFSPMAQVWRMSSYGVTRAHTILQEEISRLRLDVRTVNPSALWLAFLLSYDAQCLQTQIFGIPGPDYCRFRSRGFIPSHYWNLHSEAMCEAPVGTELPSRYEAQILWALAESYNLTYEEPSWN